MSAAATRCCIANICQTVIVYVIVHKHTYHCTCECTQACSRCIRIGVVRRETFDKVLPRHFEIFSAWIDNKYLISLQKSPKIKVFFLKKNPKAAFLFLTDWLWSFSSNFKFHKHCDSDTENESQTTNYVFKLFTCIDACRPMFYAKIYVGM